MNKMLRDAVKKSYAKERKDDYRCLYCNYTFNREEINLFHGEKSCPSCGEDDIVKNN